MDTLPLVAEDHRGAATLVPIFDYDAQPLQQIRGALLQAYGQAYGSPDAVEKEEVRITGEATETTGRALLYRPYGEEARGAILHIHGGGWIAGSADMMAGFCAELAERHSVLVLSVDYRLVPDAPGDAALDDCFAALSWLSREAAGFGVDPDRIAILGDSAGGNLAAGAALLARDAGLPLAAQLLIYPALDDRTGGPESLFYNPYAGEFVLSSKYLRQLWKARLSQVAPERLAYLAPARAPDLAGLAPAFIVTGSLDILVDETIDYAARLGRAGVPIDLRVYSGVYHAFDLVPGSTTDHFRDDLATAIEAFLNRSLK